MNTSCNIKNKPLGGPTPPKTQPTTPDPDKNVPVKPDKDPDPTIHEPPVKEPSKNPPQGIKNTAEILKIYTLNTSLFVLSFSITLEFLN